MVAYIVSLSYNPTAGIQRPTVVWADAKAFKASPALYAPVLVGPGAAEVLLAISVAGLRIDSWRPRRTPYR